MTSVAHTLTGLTLGTAGMPLSASRWRLFWVLNLCGLAANVPDLPFPGWGHDAYRISHSVFVSLGLLALLWAVLAFAAPVRRWMGDWRGVGLVSVAWLSHMLLDSFYGHGRGIAIYWPLSDAHLTLPIPWFHTVELNPWQRAHNLRVFGVELACYGPVLAAAVALRVWRVRSRSPRTSQGASAPASARRSERSRRARGSGTS